VTEERHSGPEFEAAVEQRVELRMAEEAEKAAQQELVDRVETIEANVEQNRMEIEAVAAGYSEIATNQEALDIGQLSAVARRKIKISGLTYGAGGTGAIYTLIEIAKAVLA